MTLTLDDLEKRVALLEREVAQLREVLERWRAGEAAARGGRLLHDAELGQAALAAGWAKAMEQMGIRGQPVGAEKVQEMIAACGSRPEDNEFSRGIIDMREE